MTTTTSLVFGRSRSPRRELVVFESRWLTVSTEIVGVRGDVDATNADAFTDYVLRDSARRHAMILDMRSVSFMGIEGFSALHRIAVSCAAAESHWVVVPSPAVSRVLSICDPDGLLPCTDTMNAAIESI
jgi:anti-anti-sigma factor